MTRWLAPMVVMLALCCIATAGATTADPASREWAERVLERVERAAPEAAAPARAPTASPNTTPPVAATSAVSLVWLSAAGLGIGALALYAILHLYRSGSMNDKLVVMTANWKMFVLGLVVGIGQYMVDYGAAFPTDAASWKKFALGAMIAVILPAFKSVFTGSRPESGQTPKGTEAVLAERTPKGMTSFLPPESVAVVPLVSVGEGPLALPRAPAPDRAGLLTAEPAPLRPPPPVDPPVVVHVAGHYEARIVEGKGQWVWIPKT